MDNILSTPNTVSSNDSNRISIMRYYVYMLKSPMIYYLTMSRFNLNSCTFICHYTLVSR